MLELLKLIVPLIGGGFAGALLKAWLDKRSNRLQKIPLIERVNRLVSPEIKGFTLARVTGSPDMRRLEEINKIREYQLTLHNTSPLHLQDVEALAERPMMSKTPPVSVDAEVISPWKSAYRWRIPRLPSGDSMEFTFRAIDPPSDDYEVSLYKSERVVIEKSTSERVSERRSFEWRSLLVYAVYASVAAGSALALYSVFVPPYRTVLSTVQHEECSVVLSSSFNHLDDGSFFGSATWKITSTIEAYGPANCVMQSESLSIALTKFRDSPVRTTTSISTTQPKPVTRSLSIGRDNPTHTSGVRVYEQVK